MISVIVPVYMVEDYLRRCVESILAQTYRDIEVILVDDGSPDNCGALCEELAAEDGRCRVIHQKNGGLSAARNTGIEAARGEYIALVDSDDYIAPEMCEKLLAALTENDADLAFCSSVHVREDGSQDVDGHVPRGVYTGEEGLSLLQGEGWWHYVTAWNRLYRRELFDGLLFPVGKVHEDQFIAHRLIARCRRVVGISDELYYYVHRPGSITSTALKVNRLDDVEALCDRCRFYRELGREDLVQPTIQIMKGKYEEVRAYIRPQSPAERERVRAVDALFRAMLYSREENKTAENRLLYTLPGLGISCKILRRKGKKALRLAAGALGLRRD